jgi:hypothetical protein
MTEAHSRFTKSDQEPDLTANDIGIVLHSADSVATGVAACRLMSSLKVQTRLQRENCLTANLPFLIGSAILPGESSRP